MKTEGVLVPIVTPFAADGSVNADALRTLVERFIEAGVAGIVACGTTGEYYALEEDERELVLRTVAEATRGRVTAIAGINALSTAICTPTRAGKSYMMMGSFVACATVRKCCAIPACSGRL